MSLIGSLMLTAQADAFEAFDGRLQLHGNYEMQLRAISAGFGEDWDVTQWYHVLNLELELDIAPDGFGPFDLLSAFIRAEVRFDCIYSRGCGMFRSMNTFGDRSQSLPRRLSNATQTFARGQFLVDGATGVQNGQYRDGDRLPPIYPGGVRLSGGNTDPVGLDKTAGFRTFLGIHGADQQLGTPRLEPCSTAPGVGDCPLDVDAVQPGFKNPGFDPDVAVDPARRAVYGRCRDSQIDCRLFAGGSKQFNGVGEVFDRAAIEALFFLDGTSDLVDAAEIDRILASDLFQAKPTYNDGDVLRPDDPAPYLLGELGTEFRFTQINRPGGSSNGNPIQILGPWLPKNFVDPNATLADRINPFDNYRDPLINRCPEGVANCDGYYTLNEGTQNFNPPSTSTPIETGPVNVKNNESVAPVFDFRHIDFGLNSNNRLRKSDYELNPNGRPVSSPVLQAAAFNAAFSNRDFQAAFAAEGVRIKNQLCGGVSCPLIGALVEHFALAKLARNAQNKVLRVTGSGSSGYRPIPLGDPGDAAKANTIARGLYIPSKGLVEAIKRERINYYPFNIDQNDRQWNRGASQKQTKELKEAYLDMEFFDNALWVRLGKQTIVWGKTELFRTTDQFNPQDFALATLPSLEESRIALWAFKGVYSLYEVGPLEDVRLELAFNFDEFQPADLGGCGEPYTVDLICSLTFGALAHGAAGIGVAGLDRPADPWDDIKGLEGGVRIEFRWDMFTFAITDFYGFNDLPSLTRISTFERNVDPTTGRPRAFGKRGPCGLPTGAENNYYPDPDCLRPGPQFRLELRDDGICDGRFVVGYGDKGNGTTIPDTRTPCTVANVRVLPSHNVGSSGNKKVDASVVPFVPGATQLSPKNRLPYFSKNDAYLADPNDLRHRYADPSDELYQGNRWDALADADKNTRCGDRSMAGSDAATCVASLYFPQFDKRNNLVDRPGILAEFLFRPETAYSPNNALEASPVNLQFYNLVCAATVGFSTLDPTSCAVNIFSSRNETRTIPALIISQTLGLVFAGAQTLALSGGSALAGAPPPLVTLWRDQLTVRAGRSREFLVSAFAGCFDVQANNIFDQVPAGRLCDSDDPQAVVNGTFTLNRALTPEQEAILGCGPFFGTNCDGSGIDLLWGELSAWVQSFPGVEGTVDLAGQGWRTDGLPAGSLTHIFTFGSNDLDDSELCKDSGDCKTISDADDHRVGQRLIVSPPSPYNGLTTDQVRMLFTPGLPNCSTWLGRVNPYGLNPDCVNRYAQPGTIGARHIGWGDFTDEGLFVPRDLAAPGQDPDQRFPNFIKQRGPICTTATFGGAVDQVLPGCRRKWRNYQDEHTIGRFDINGDGDTDDFREEERLPTLNLYGIDARCAARTTAQRRFTPECNTHPEFGTPLTQQTGFVGDEYGPRGDPRSWDVTRDGDPDFLGYDSQARITGPQVKDRPHPGTLFRTLKRGGNANSLPVSGRCNYEEGRAVNQANAVLFVFSGGATVVPGLGKPQCSRHHRAPGPREGDPIFDRGPGPDDYTDEVGRSVFALGNQPRVYPKGTGHPFTGQPWANELAAFSWNLFNLLVFTSPAYDALKIADNLTPQTAALFPQQFKQPLNFTSFNPNDPDNFERVAEIVRIQKEPDTETTRAEIRALRAAMKPICSFITPKKCEGVGGILGLAGQGSPQVRAGGNGRFGRRTASFQAGGEVILTYEKRNVLGFSMDFAEDTTKSSWGVEFTWIPNIEFNDANSFSNVSEADTFNLTISVDRPTFVNFLNANHTFFVTSQWFFQYIDGYKKSFRPQGPYNILGIFLITTGYFQDRLLPTLLFVYDVQSNSGASTLSFRYRYTDSFSISFGAALFWGHEEFTPTSVNGIGPPGNRLGPHAFEDSIQPGLSLVKDRDELWMKLRYTF